MRFCQSLVCAIAAHLPFVAAAPLEEGGQPTLPTKDTFYKVPDNIGDYAPGQIVALRKPPYPIASFGISSVNLADSWQILYRTNDNFENATATVLTILVPHNADFTKVLSYQVAQDSAYANCAPSYAFQLKSATGGPLGTMLSQVELLLMQAALEQGWVVISPDHEGPKAAYLANKLAGYATLDGPLGMATPQIPLYVYKSVRDEVSPIKETDDLVNKYCAGGAKVTYDRDLLSDHATIAILGVGKSLSWLKDIMNGRPGPTKCSTKTLISSLLDLKALTMITKTLLDTYLNLLGSPVGPPWIRSADE